MTNEEAIKRLKSDIYKYSDFTENPNENEFWTAFDKAIKALEHEAEAVQFAKWLATEIFDDMWEYNKYSFAEIACRKLAKLGIVRENGDKWELVEPHESEDKK